MSSKPPSFGMLGIPRKSSLRLSNISLQGASGFGDFLGGVFSVRGLHYKEEQINALSMSCHSVICFCR